MASLAKMLKTLNKEWKETEPAEITDLGFKPDEGEYLVVLEPAKVELSKNTERLQIAWPFKFIKGKYKGKRYTKYDGLDNSVSMSFVKAILQSFGISIPKNFQKLPEVLEDFFENDYNDRPVNATIRHQDEYTNVYFNGFADEDADENEDENEDSDTDKDIPSAKEVKKMKKKELKNLIEEFELDIDEDDYDDLSELREAVIEELEDL
jgi:hypothetical protein